MSSEGFIGTADTFMLFFKLCQRYNINGEKERIELLRKLVKHQRAKYIRNPQELFKGKKILKIVSKEPPSA